MVHSFAARRCFRVNARGRRRSPRPSPRTRHTLEKNPSYVAACRHWWYHSLWRTHLWPSGQAAHCASSHLIFFAFEGGMEGGAK